MKGNPISTFPCYSFHIGEVIQIWLARLVGWDLGSSHIINRPCVAGAVLQSASSFTDSVGQPFPPNLQNIINYKPEEPGSWNFERKSTPHNMSHVTSLSSKYHKLQTRRARELRFLRECSPPTTCHMSHVACHMSCVMCHMSHVTCHVSCVTFFILFFSSDKVVKLIGGGSVINGAYPI